MAAIGSIEFVTNTAHDSGVALRLVKRPRERVTATWDGVQMQASPDCPWAIFQFNGVVNLSDGLNKGLALVEPILDMLSMTGKSDLLLQETANEHLVWWKAGQEQIFAYVTTSTFGVGVGNLAIEVRDKDGNVVPPVPVLPIHHIGFRFFRLAQTSDDLFDAYRNMYLAFESLLSSRYPKGKGKEIDWLKASLEAATAELTLVNLAPHSANPVATILDQIYGNTRLPLFHAKHGTPYFAPSANASERGATQAALSTLTQLVIRMAGSWYRTARKGGWVYESFLRDANRKAFAGSQFIFSDQPNVPHPDDADLNHDSIRLGIPFAAHFSDTYEGTERQNVFGEVPVSALVGRGRFHAIYLANATSPLMWCTPDTTIDLGGFDTLRTLVFIRSNNQNAPKYLYAR